jgi:hypothetical protein
MMKNESMMSSDEFCHVPVCYASCAVAEVGLLVAVHIERLTVVAQRVAPSAQHRVDKG